MRKSRAGESAASHIWELNGPNARAEQGLERRAPSSLGRKFSALLGRRNASLVGRRAPVPGNALSFEGRCGARAEIRIALPADGAENRRGEGRRIGSQGNLLNIEPDLIGNFIRHGWI